MFSTLAQFTSWVATNWLYPHGSDEAQDHIRRKLSEEKTEFLAALLMEDTAEIVSEMGDLLWCATAAMLNANLDPEEALHRSRIGTLIPEGNIAVGTIDALGLDAVLPWHDLIGDVFEGVDHEDRVRRFVDGDLESTVHIVAELGHDLSKAAHMRRFLQDSTAYGHEAMYRARAERSYAQLVLALSRVAQHLEAGGIESIMDNVHAKQTKRLAEGRAVTSPPK